MKLHFIKQNRKPKDSHHSVNPQRTWSRAVTFALVIIALLLTSGFFLYYLLLHTNTFTPTADNLQTSQFDTDELTDLAAELEARADYFNNLLNSSANEAVDETQVDEESAETEDETVVQDTDPVEGANESESSESDIEAEANQPTPTAVDQNQNNSAASPASNSPQTAPQPLP